ncbi:MAG TPA: hypothetical protein VEX41_09000 [Candidatus Eisenbacteria bacterium]|nr:hypothetical protein [Candidatus Eisenbacteria bacterium]
MSGLRVERVADEIIAADAALATASGRAGKTESALVVPAPTPARGRGEPGMGVPAVALGGGQPAAHKVERGRGIPWTLLAGGLLVLLVALGGGIALGLIGGGQPVQSPAASLPVAVATPSPSPLPSPSPSPSPTPSPSPSPFEYPVNTVFDGCIGIDPQGNTTVLTAAFTVINPQAGQYAATFAQSPSGPLSGSGTATNGGNPVAVPMRAFLFGTYDALAITAPDGSPVALGPLAAQLPLPINAETNQPNGCDPAALQVPTQQALAGRAYLAAVAPVNLTQAEFATKAQAWTSATTNEVAQTDAAALLAALRAVHEQLLDIAARYPPAADSLRASDEAVLRLIADLEDLAQLESIGPSAWLDRYAADISQLAAASKVLREVFGLPPLAVSP